MMGTVPADRRGIAAGARTMLQNTGAVHLDRLRAGDRHLVGAQGHAVQDLLRRGHRPLGRASSTPFIHNMHMALWVLAATSLVGACSSCLHAAASGRT